MLSPQKNLPRIRLLTRQSCRPIRTHEGEVITLKPNLRWCSDTLQIRFWKGEKVEVAFAFDCCDREVITWIATKIAINGERIKDPIIEAVENRFGRVEAFPHKFQWLLDNGGCYTAEEIK